MIYVIGIGPGSKELMTMQCIDAIKDAEVIVGYKTYINLITDLIEGKEIVQNGMRQEIDRCREAVEIAKTGKKVAVISSGDAGIYGMAGLILEMKGEEEVEIIPGITASSSAGSVLGAPLMHDNCNISLSDLMTPYEEIKNRVKAAAESDFIISLYNPKSKGRPHYLKECIDIIKEFREDTTPIAVVKHALREGQEVTMTTIGEFNDEIVDMMSIVIIGNTKSFYKNGSFITPRGYNDKKRDKIKR